MISKGRGTSCATCYGTGVDPGTPTPPYFVCAKCGGTGHAPEPPRRRRGLFRRRANA